MTITNAVSRSSTAAAKSLPIVLDILPFLVLGVGLDQISVDVFEHLVNVFHRSAKIVKVIPFAALSRISKRESSLVAGMDLGDTFLDEWYVVILPAFGSIFGLPSFRTIYHNAFKS